MRYELTQVYIGLAWRLSRILRASGKFLEVYEVLHGLSRPVRSKVPKAMYAAKPIANSRSEASWVEVTHILSLAVPVPVSHTMTSLIVSASESAGFGAATSWKDGPG